MARSSATLQPRSVSVSQATTAEPRRKEGHRDTIEAVVVAFILALVVRGFDAQAFVIPTGSMAPTLMGRHKEVACEQCGYVFAVNASDEVELGSVSRKVSWGICVNCRHQERLYETPSFAGDRILVMMFPYDLPFLPGSRPPGRWDVVVFRYPEEPEVSYIKRLVGLPGIFGTGMGGMSMGGYGGGGPGGGYGGGFGGGYGGGFGGSFGGGSDFGFGR